MTQSPSASLPLRPVWWDAAVQPNGALALIDQTRLPAEQVELRCTALESVIHAIRTLQVRGAPAIGVAAAYGVVVGLNEFPPGDESWPQRVRQICDFLAASRPTAVNLFHALDRMRKCADQLHGKGWLDARDVLLQEAHTLRAEDAAMCRAIGQAGRNLIQNGMGVLTHCNAGALATSEYGTALAVLYAAREAGRTFKVFADETRPLLQGARLTAWELLHAGVDTTLICDNMAASLMAERRIHLVITGADRIAANGDTANKIGTYGVAVLAAAHGIPFYIAAPSTTFDLNLKDGGAIPIEHRDPAEVRTIGGQPIAPAHVPCHNPAFDVTPARLITGIITEKGVIYPVSAASIRRLVGR